MRKWLVILLIFAAMPAAAAWYPKMETGAVRIQVGETTTVRVVPVWTGIWLVPWHPWVFDSTNPAVARVEGRMDTSWPGEMRITGVRPGRANGVIQGWTDFYRVEVTVVCASEVPVQAAPVQQTVKAGESVVLQAQTPIASRTTFTWYRGRVGDQSSPLAQSGPEITLVAEKPGTQYAWVLATTACSSSTAEFTIDAVVPRRRSARH
jgi:PKD domain